MGWLYKFYFLLFLGHSIEVQYIPQTLTPPEKKAQACISYDEKANTLVTFGGLNGLTSFNSIHIFNLSSNQWKIIETHSVLSPLARQSPACMIYKSTLYIKIKC